MASVLPRLTLSVAALALVASSASAQRPALTGEKARVAEAVRADLSKLSDLQKAHHSRTKVFAADARDLNFAPTSGAQVNIAYASMNAWAANATHPVLSPIACFIIISAAEPTGPAAEPFCQEGRPGTPGTVATQTPAPQAAPQPAPQQQAAAQQPPAQPQQAQPQAAQPQRTPTTQPSAPAPQQPAAERPAGAVTQTPAQAAPARTQQQVAQAPAQTPAQRTEQGMTPATPAAPLRQPTVTSAPAPSAAPIRGAAGLVTGDISAQARANTRESNPSGAIVSQQAENVTAQQFSQKLAEFAQGATAIFMTQPAELVRIVRDPYESTAEFERRRAEAIAAAQRREQEFFRQNNRTYNVAMPIRDVRYDADREVLEFTVDGIGLPITRSYGDDAGTPALTFTCYTRPVFWCSPETGMSYEAGDLWRLPRATARQHDVLRSPLTLYARFAVGRREDSPTLAISLLSMDLHARGTSVSRWDGSAR